MVKYYAESWKDLDSVWQPLLSVSDHQVLRGLSTVFDDEWLRREGERLRLQGDCHHLYRWLTVPLGGQPVRQLRLAEAVAAIERTMATGRMREHLALLLRHLAAYSAQDCWGFFAREFEVIILGNLLRAEAGRVEVMGLEVGAGKTHDILLHINGRPVYVELKTLQRTNEETDLAEANNRLLRVIDDVVQLSAGTEIQLARIPDGEDCAEIAATLKELEIHRQTVEVKVAAGLIRYGFTESGIGIGYGSSPKAAERRVRRILKDVAAKAVGVNHPRVLFLRRHYFDRQDVQVTALRESLRVETHRGLAAVVLVPNAPIRMGDEIVDEPTVLLHRTAGSGSLSAEELQVIVAAAGL